MWRGLGNDLIFFFKFLNIKMLKCLIFNCTLVKGVLVVLYSKTCKTLIAPGFPCYLLVG